MGRVMAEREQRHEADGIVGAGGRRPVLAVIGFGGEIPSAVEACAAEVGAAAMAAGWRLVTGGLGGVMRAVSRGARSSPAWREGRILGFLPSYDRDTANPYVDVALGTGLQIGRNVLVVAAADVVLAIGGGAGTLSEMAIAWQLGKPIVSLETVDGWGARLAGEPLDHRHPRPVAAARTPSEAIVLAGALLRTDRREPGDIGSGWAR